MLPTLGFVRLVDSLAYLLAFAVGTVVAMAGFASVLGRLSGWFATGHLKLYRGLMYTASVTAFAVGGWWLFVP